MYACGPAVLQMVLAYKNIHTNQVLLADIVIPTNEGTEETALEEGLREHGLCPVPKEQATLADIENALIRGNPVIVGFLEPSRNEGHYGVVSGYDDSHLYIHDPWVGPKTPFLKADFPSCWRSESGKYTHWMLEAQEKRSD